MALHAHFHPAFSAPTDVELFARIHAEIVQRYAIDEKLASEMAWDLVEVLTAVDADITIFEKYFLH